MNVCLVVYIEINIVRRIDNKEIIECNCKILCISIFVLLFFFFFYIDIFKFLFVLYFL